VFVMLFFFFFFFSSRRRHTRSKRDWSSDVCSSDLTILYCTRIYLAMAQDGLFFRSLARVHPRYRTPATSIVVQGGWAIALTFSGTYEQLYTYVVFAMFLFHAATGAAVIVLRRTRPGLPRPYRAWGYPVVPCVFIL